MRQRILSALMVVFVVVLFVDSATAVPVRWEIAGGGNGHYYDLINSDPITWHDALAAAALITPPAGYAMGHLTTISDAAENAFITTALGALIINDDGAWFGFTDEAVEGEWRWIDDTPGFWQDPDNFANPIQTAYTNWDSGEPNDLWGEDFGSMRSNGTWNDFYNHSRNNRQYLVEFSPIPEPSTLALLGIGGLALIVFGLLPAIITRTTFRRAAFLIGAISAVGFTQSAHAASVHWEIGAGGNDHWYELVENPLPWEDALADAPARVPPAGYNAGHLVTITDA